MTKVDFQTQPWSFMRLNIQTTNRFPLAPALLCGLLAIGCAAQAALPDEIQVYDDAINKRGERGLELHLNTTVSGRSMPDYPGEIPPAHATRMTPEFSFGLSDTLEAGLYLPALMDREHRLYFGGTKLRLKWLPQRTPAGGGFFYGINAELSHVGRRFEASQNGVELRPILGYRDAAWLIATNPVLGYGISQGHRQGGPDFSPALKVSRTVAAGIALGVETYSELGKLARFAPRGERQHTLYAAIDIDRAPWAFNLGIGRGLNPATDRWTLKAIFDLPLSTGL